MMKLSEAYQVYKDDPSPKARDILGEALFLFIKATVAGNFGDRFNSLQDAIGESAIKVLRSINNPKIEIKDICNFVTAVTCNTCLDMRRAHKKRREQVLVEDQSCSFRPRYISNLFLSSLLTRLTTEERVLVDLKTDGMTNRGIANLLKTTEGAIKQKWSRLGTKLRTLGVDQN